MLDDSLLAQLRTVFATLDVPVELVLRPSDHERQAELLELARAVASTSPSIAVRVGGERTAGLELAVHAGGAPTRCPVASKVGSSGSIDTLPRRALRRNRMSAALTTMRCSQVLTCDCPRKSFQHLNAWRKASCTASRLSCSSRSSRRAVASIRPALSRTSCSKRASLQPVPPAAGRLRVADPDEDISADAFMIAPSREVRG